MFAADWDFVTADRLPASGQAVLLLVVDADLPLGRISLQGPQGTIRLRPAARRQMRLATVVEGDAAQVADGEHTALLLALPPGEYRLQRVERVDSKQKLELQPAWSDPFGLQAGRIGYPGDFRLAALAGGGLRQSRENHLARWLPLLQGALPALFTEHAPEWIGGGIDPFPQLWQARGRAAAASAEVTLPPTLPDCDPEQDWRCAWLPALLQPPALPLASLSPDGRWLVLGERRGRRLQLRVEHLASGFSEILPADLGEQTRLGWCGPACLALTHGRGRSARVSLLRLDWSGEAIGVRRHSVPLPGEVIDSLPALPDQLLFGRTDDPDGEDALSVYRLSLDEDGVDRRQLRTSQRLDGELRNELGWLADATGQLRLALVRDEAGHALLPANGGAPILRAPIDAHLDLLGVHDGAALAISDHQRPARQLLALPLDGGPPRLLAALRRCPGCVGREVDLAGALLDVLGEQPLALRYYRQGLLQMRMLDRARAARLRGLLEDPGQWSLNLARIAPAASAAVDEEAWLYLLEQAGDAASAGWWLQSAAASPPRSLGRLRPALACTNDPDAPACRDGGPRPLRSEALALRSTDGWPLEAFLSLPAEIEGPERPYPLLLMPHGGPLGVADNRHFDPLLHWLTAHGYAVLQVNFRGSFGYGRAFRDAAFGQTGVGIEADQLAVLDQLLASDPRLDRERICAMGTSHGGYSALMLALARPSQIDCVVALAAFTDLALRHSSADWNDDALQREVQLRLHGDPASELASLQVRSPLYRFEGLQPPLLLGHGRLDRRVHPEHSERLALMLTAAGRPPRVLWFDNEGHGLNRLDNQLRWYRQLVAFLDQHLAEG